MEASSSGGSKTLNAQSQNSATKPTKSEVKFQSNERTETKSTLDTSRMSIASLTQLKTSTSETSNALPATSTPKSPNNINLASLLQSSKASIQQPLPSSLSSSRNNTTDSSNSTSKGTTSMLAKFKTAGKSVQNMVRVSNIVAAPRVPSLAAAVEREDFDELNKRNDEYFARLLSSQV